MQSNQTTLRDDVIALETSFNTLRNQIVSRLDECSDHIKSAKEICQKAADMAVDLENKLANASNEEKEWKDIKVKLATTAISGRVILNVGGDRYTTSVDTLTREKDTFFTALFSKQWQLERDPDDKSIFIDRNGRIFTYILEYLRTDIVPVIVLKDPILRNTIIIEAQYFRLHSLIKLLSPVYFPNSTLLQEEHKRKLNEFYGTLDQRWELIYRGSRDGFDATAFHSRCDNKGPTMTIIRSDNNYLFGGYTALPWTSQGDYKTDVAAFLFTLTNPHDIPPTKYVINPASLQKTVYHHAGYGPTFGGHDIYLSNRSNANNSSYTGFPASYMDRTGKGNNTFSGARNFSTSDIEVFKPA